MSVPRGSGALPPRRTLLAIAVAVLLTLSAGCTGVLGGDTGAGDDGAKLDSVPERADAIAYIDVDGMLEADQHRTLANTVFESLANASESYDGPENVEGGLTEAQNTSGVDITEVDAVTSFSASSESGEYSGAIVETSLSESAFVSATAENRPYNFTESAYNGQTLYEPTEVPRFETPTYIGVLGDGVYVTGTEDAVKDAIDTSVGDADPLGGDVLAAYEETADGFIRFASAVPQEELPTEAANRSVPVDTRVFETVTMVSGSHTAEGESVGLTVHLQTESGADASDVRDATDGAVSLASAYVSDEQAQEQLRNIEVTKDGSMVTIDYTAEVPALQELIRTYIQQFAGASTDE
jgi:hypothetical protein